MPRTNFYGTVAGYGEDFGDAFGDGLTLLAALAAALISASSSTVFTDWATCLASGTKSVISKAFENASKGMVPSFVKDRCPRMASFILGSLSVLKPLTTAPKMSAIVSIASLSSASDILLSPSVSR
mmetsp:Transcript_51533/g.106600  ORF Transcript_51533/g.106600 Transcript_51533/m.106600 type:complete len:126 (-) Transcript_51533:428-805(-)